VAQASFTTKLSKELRRSPKKTAVLALMGVVALWFWAPLAWKWFAPQSTSAAAAPTPPPTVNGSPVVPAFGAATSTTPAAVPAMNWKELADLLQHDPLLSSARLHEKIRDPFAVAPGEKETSDKETESKELALAAAVAVAPLTPEQLGLAVSSAIAGGSASVATINGRACCVGDVIVVPNDHAQYEFTITSIEGGEVTLASSTETYKLAIRRSDSSMQLSPRGAAKTNQLDGGNRIVLGARSAE
jgi:hypothetical protein